MKFDNARQIIRRSTLARQYTFQSSLGLKVLCPRMMRFVAQWDAFKSKGSLSVSNSIAVCQRPRSQHLGALVILYEYQKTEKKLYNDRINMHRCPIHVITVFRRSFCTKKCQFTFLPLRLSLQENGEFSGCVWNKSFSIQDQCSIPSITVFRRSFRTQKCQFTFLPLRLSLLENLTCQHHLLCRV